MSVRNNRNALKCKRAFTNFNFRENIYAASNILIDRADKTNTALPFFLTVVDERGIVLL